MTEPIILGLIGSLGTFLTVVGAIISQSLNQRQANKEQKAIKKVATETKIVSEETLAESKESFSNIETLLHNLQDAIDRQRRGNIAIMQERLRYLLTLYQDRESITFAEKESLVGIYNIYIEEGGNGIIKSMYDNSFSKLKVTA